MQKMRKIFAGAMALMLIVGLLQFSVVPAYAAETSGTCGANLNWTFDSTTGTLTITGTGEMESWLYNTNDRPWDSVCKQIKVLNVGMGVTSIGANAFMQCENLTKATLPDSIVRIEENAFNWCVKLSDFTMPGKVTYLGEGAFADCRSLPKVTIPKTVTFTGLSLFNGCSSLASVTIEEGAQGLNVSVFANCSKLTSIHIPSSVTFMDQGLVSCSSLTSITVSPNNPQLYSTGNCLIDRINKRLVAGCIASVLPTDGSVAEIGRGAFRGHQIVSIVIPTGVTTIQSEAFFFCRKLESVTIPKSVTQIGSMAFDYCAENLTIYGYKGTRAESYANENGIRFVALCSEHTYGPWTDNRDGTHTRTCSNCQEPETQSHTYGKWTNNGNEHIRSCPTCGATETQNHGYGKWQDQGAGGHFRTCDACGKSEPQNHNYGKYTVVNEQVHMRICAECKREDKQNHTWDIGTVTLKPTEDSTGTRVYKCTACGTEKQESIPKLDHEHKYDSDWKKDDSNHWQECYCGDKGNISGHKYDTGKPLQEATCQQEGKVLYTCQSCGYQKTETANGTHKPGEWTVVTEAACTEAGLQEQKCLTCGAVVQEQAIGAKGHTFGEWVTIKKPTDAEPGEETRTCHCGATEARTVSASATEPSGPQNEPSTPAESQNGDAEKETDNSKSADMTWVIIVVAIAGLLAIAIVIILLLRKKRKENAE